MPDGRIADSSGSSVPGLRFLPSAGSDSKREVASGESASWRFDFAATREVPKGEAFSSLIITGEGTQPQRVMVRLQGRDPLRLDRLGFCLKLVAVFCVSWACIAVFRRMRAARFQSDRPLVVTPKAPIPNLIEVVPHRGGGMKLKGYPKRNALKRSAAAAPSFFNLQFPILNFQS